MDGVAVLVNCTLSGNSAAYDGGGSFYDGLINCVVYCNTASTANSNYFGGIYEHCCMAPLPAGEGNIASPPQFLDPASSNFHLAYGSPCIDSGNNLPGITDDIEGTVRPLDGNFNGTPDFDMGAYEYNPATADSDGDTMFDNWEHRYGLNPTNPADAAIDSDSDTVLNKNEHTADTVPTNSASVFRITGIGETNSFSVIVGCTNSRVYGLQFNADLLTGSWSAVEGQTNRPGEADGAMSLVDTNDAAHRAYRVGVGLP
ncbi:MAG: hypothetical protein KKC51_04850 [Verrucomicrobia bacterium]|nr:hypothetical protein [Verrucomicrobiota bacterium]